MKSEKRKALNAVSAIFLFLLILFLHGCGGGGGDSSQVNEVPPSAPAAVAAVAGDRQVTLSWNSNGATSYNIYMASQSGVTKANYGTLAGGMAHLRVTSPYTHPSLANGTTYYFVVTSVDRFGESSESSEVAATPAANSVLTVSGSVKYEDKEYGANGFTGNTSYKAVRFAEVQAVNSSNGATLVSGTTDAAGLYNLTIPSASSIYIRVTSSATSPAVDVKDFSNALYAVAGSTFTASGAATANISIPATNAASGAFNALDVFASGAQFVQPLSTSFPPLLNAYWQTGNANGTYYCTSAPDPACARGEGIYILNYSGDTDEYDDDVLWHEYGHFIADKFSKDDAPGGAHYVYSNDLDLRLTWSEGWGDFFPGAIKDWLAPALLSTAQGMPTSIYVDTTNGGGLFFDFGNPPAGTDYFYASNEAAVAKVLHGMRATVGMQSVWDVFTSNYLKLAASPVNLEVFWDGWDFFGKPDITAILAERSIKYSADGYETSSDNSPNIARKAVLRTPEEHTLFGSADKDYIAFDATAGTQYTVKTTLLKNGADTIIGIIASDGTTPVPNTINDNTNGANYAVPPFVPNNCDMYFECHENGFDILGSTKSFVAAATGVYYVEVKSSANRPLSAGRYGDYTLTVTSP